MQGYSSMNSRFGRWLVSLPPTLFLLLFFVAPSLIMVVASFRFPGEYGGLAPLVEHGRWQLTLETYRFFFSDFIYAEIFIKSFGVALATTLICILLAYPLAWLIARSPKKHQDVMVLLAVLPFASNFLIRVYAWMIILGPQAAAGPGGQTACWRCSDSSRSRCCSRPSPCWWAWCTCICPS